MTKTFIPLDDLANQLAHAQHGDNTEDRATLFLDRVNAVPGCFTARYAVVALAEGINRKNIDALVAAGRIRLHDPITYAPTNEIRGALVDKDEVIRQIMSGEHVPLLKEAKAAPAAKVEAVTPTTLNDDAAHDENLAALFDPVPVEALAKTFPADTSEESSLQQWKAWADKAKANGLIDARPMRARFNLYKAGLWFVRKGAKGWDNARLFRVLAANLPARSLDDKRLLTGE